MYFYPTPGEGAARCTFDGIVIVGQQKIADGLWPSDHFGLLSTFTIYEEDGISGAAAEDGGRVKVKRTELDPPGSSKQAPISIE
ncbi:unnamed protein product [Phytophthora fragariaefolia]|uniref:Unnamed protein product n=1 Tax=Phytophthora fragariaefolia TaxID=1490495 RepID=A0A9W6X7S4_9STRA|nr:unnamed protein product [Phytophthora fragariaefolia]